VGIVQMPCPELVCLGLDRGNVTVGCRSVVEENTRIREWLSKQASTKKIKQLAHQITFQILEYKKHGFEVKGIVGVNRSPSCGVETTSKDNQEVAGEGIFIEELRDQLKKKDVLVKLIGIKATETDKAVIKVKELLGLDR
jgi:predicted secreted protein